MTSVLIFCDDLGHSQPVGLFTTDTDPRLPDDVVVLGCYEPFEGGNGWHAMPFSGRWGGKVQNPYRDGQQWLDANGQVIETWGLDLERSATEIERAHTLAGGGQWNPRRRYALKCPECGRELRRHADPLEAMFNRLAAQGITGISLAGLEAC